MKWWELDTINLVFCKLSFKPAFSLSPFTLIKRFFTSSSLSAIKMVIICISEVVDISSGNLEFYCFLTCIQVSPEAGKVVWYSHLLNKSTFHCDPHSQRLSVQFSSVAWSCPTLCDPMNRSTPDLPVHHQLLEFTQTHVHRVCDAIQPSHPLSSPSSPAPNPSQHQSLFQWVNSSHEVAKCPLNFISHSPFIWTCMGAH